METTNTEISIVKQCTLLSINRASFYYKEKGENPLNLKLMRLIDEQYLNTPFYGSRQMTRHLQRQEYCVGRKRRHSRDKHCLYDIYENM